MDHTLSQSICEGRKLKPLSSSESINIEESSYLSNTIAPQRAAHYINDPFLELGRGNGWIQEQQDKKLDALLRSSWRV
ncbi:unnamed protein product [Diplocarpon coronariae]|uniref:Uncharacterized protein n=1 Tax=Diplocarpon coronariae TaxID=2795749 RepID=A0A218YUZ7_9HELO|nr:hypothetical protein B2J93_1617 [Marssonina coronariae]